MCFAAICMDYGDLGYEESETGFIKKAEDIQGETEGGEIKEEK